MLSRFQTSVTGSSYYIVVLWGEASSGFLEAREKPWLFSLIWEAQGIGLGLNKVDIKLPPTLTFLFFFFFFWGGGGGGVGGGGTVEYPSLEIIIPYYVTLKKIGTK